MRCVGSTRQAARAAADDDEARAGGQGGGGAADPAEAGEACYPPPSPTTHNGVPPPTLRRAFVSMNLFTAVPCRDHVRVTSESFCSGPSPAQRATAHGTRHGHRCGPCATRPTSPHRALRAYRASAAPPRFGAGRVWMLTERNCFCLNRIARADRAVVGGGGGCGRWARLGYYCGPARATGVNWSRSWGSKV